MLTFKYKTYALSWPMRTWSHPVSIEKDSNLNPEPIFPKLASHFLNGGVWPEQLIMCSALFLKTSCFYMCNVHIHVGMCVYGCRSQMLILGVFFNHSVLRFLKQGLSLDPELASLASLGSLFTWRSLHPPER